MTKATTTTDPMILIRFLGGQTPGSRSVIEFPLTKGGHEHYKLMLHGKAVKLKAFNGEEIIDHNGGSVICLDGRQIYLVQAQISYPGDGVLTMCPLIRSGRQPAVTDTPTPPNVHREDRPRCRPAEVLPKPDPRTLLGRPRGCKRPRSSAPASR